MKTIYPQFLQHITSNQLIQNDETIILGFSGGKDSVTLLLLLKELQRRKAISFKLVAAYFNHKLREDASEEELWIQNFCDALNVDLVVGGKDVLKFKNQEKLNLEHAASISRYTFFQKVSENFENARVATAHTKSDLTETFFIKLFRGSGLQGLSTIYSKKENTIIRPMLLFPQEKILSFLKRNKVQYYIDSTNSEDTFLRTRIRHHLVPEVKKIEPTIDKQIFKTVSIIQEEYNYFNLRAQKVLSRFLILDKILPSSTLTNLHVALQRHVIREYIRRVKGNLLNIDYSHIEAIRLTHESSGGIAIPGVELTFQKGFIFPNGLSIPVYNYKILAPCSGHIEAIGRTIRISKRYDFVKPEDNATVIIPLQADAFPLVVRSPEKEDKYVKLNTTVNQKVFEMIRAFGYPAPLRNLCPVVLNENGEIIWSLGSPVADKFKVLKKTHREFLEISIRR